MQTKSIFTNWGKEELKALFKESVSETIKEQLSLLLKKKDNGDEQELLTRKQVADIYCISFVTLREWERNKIIPKPIRKGARVYWRKSDIIADIQQIPNHK